MEMASSFDLVIVGGGLAGSEAAWQIASTGVPVVIHEMRPERMTDAHKTDAFAELVCSNSFRSDDKEHNAVGLLHEGQAGDDPERVREGMSGNLCRCAAYAGITEAILDAHRQLAERDRAEAA